MPAKTLLAVFGIVIAIGFVPANSIIPQASARQVVCPGGEVHNGGCPPGLSASTPGHNGAAPAKSSAPGQISGPLRSRSVEERPLVNRASTPPPIF